MLDGNPWRPQDIAYSILVGSVFLAALLEWFLWLAAFLYCLYMVFRKAENRSIRVLAVLVSLAFGLLRLVFLPVMAVTVPLPRQLTGYIPDSFVDPLQLFACVAFSILLGVPWLLCIYHLLRHSIGPKQRLVSLHPPFSNSSLTPPRIKEELTAATAPKVVVVMPCYHEIPEVLMTAINSACDADYPKSCLHLYVSFDGADIDDLYLSTLSSLGIALPLKTYPVSIDLVYRGVRITVSRFVHGGKRHCQKKSFRLIDKMYSSYLTTRDDLFILFIDSDIILDKFCVQNFIYEMELKNRAKPAEARAAPMLAMTGIITCTAEKRSLLTVLQDIEYVHGQLYERTVESACGSVTCLPGALTMLRFTAFRNMAKYYFAESAEHAEDIFDFGKSHLGEDRWLTHLFMLGARNRFQIQLCTGAFCKTEAVMTYRTLLKQRRRWFLGFITNEACMLTDIRLWKMYPLLCVVRMMQNTIRTTALVLFIMILSVVTGTQKFSQLPYSMIIVTLTLNWGLMVVVGWRLHRFKAWLYPLMYVVNPALNWCYLVYGIFTAGQRTWGGPRADKGGDEEEGLAGEFVDKDFVYEPVKFDQNGNAVPSSLTIPSSASLSLRMMTIRLLAAAAAAARLLPSTTATSVNCARGNTPCLPAFSTTSSVLRPGPLASLVLHPPRSSTRCTTSRICISSRDGLRKLSGGYYPGNLPARARTRLMRKQGLRRTSTLSLRPRRRGRMRARDRR
ncbi:chitin synthase D [Myxozyma melibiosi]|uniref:chitin synthase n=1 Tax=Myxozyma melibiosi TaxID=54550 RepID=A0ABR1FC28_9ASCO